MFYYPLLIVGQWPLIRCVVVQQQLLYGVVLKREGLINNEVHQQGNSIVTYQIVLDVVSESALHR